MSNTLNNFYFEINPKKKKILSSLVELERNWKNISGICYLSKDELFDLSWAGYPENGFIEFSKENEKLLSILEYPNEILNVIKLEIKQKISSLRYNVECGNVIVNNMYEVQTDDRSKIMMHLKYAECISNQNLSFKWKTKSGFIDYTSLEFIELFNQIQKFFQNLFELEFEYFDKIEKCDNILDLLEVDLNSIQWTSNNIKI